MSSIKHFKLFIDEAWVERATGETVNNDNRWHWKKLQKSKSISNIVTGKGKVGGNALISLPIKKDGNYIYINRGNGEQHHKFHNGYKLSGKGEDGKYRSENTRKRKLFT